MKNTLKESLPENLFKALVDGRVLPFVGAGVSLAILDRRQDGKSLFPSWKQLLMRITHCLNNENKRAEADLVRAHLNFSPPNYQEAAKAAAAALGPLWSQAIRDAFLVDRKYAVDSSLNLARSVWSLNSNLVITTNYDHALRWACTMHDSLHYWPTQSPAEQVSLLRQGLHHPTVWHLHGCADHLSSVVLTPDSYNRLYTHGDSENVEFGAALETLRILLSTHTFIFIGFSMDDDQLVQQIRWVNSVFEGYAGPHYVLVKEQHRASVVNKLRGLPVECLCFEEHGEPEVSLLQKLGSLTDPANRMRGPLIPPPPRLSWRVGHYDKIRLNLLDELENRESIFVDILKELDKKITSILSSDGKHLLDHRDRMLRYLANLIPDEVKATLEEFEIASLFTLAQRSPEIELLHEKTVLYDRLRLASDSVLVQNPILHHLTNDILAAVVDKADLAPISIEYNMDFTFACFRLVHILDTSLNLAPLRMYRAICPYHVLSVDCEKSTLFYISRIVLDHEAHEITIHARCFHPEIHQILATLANHVNNMLSAVGPHLDLRDISLLKATLCIEREGYEGEHHEFRTQISTIISMLMGEELYGEQRIFIRELLQNARDAVLTRRALESRNMRKYVPKVSFKMDTELGILNCCDNGIGMDRYTIERYLADVGQSYYTSGEFERLAGDSMSEQDLPVSRFGIGILSCFMVARRIVIRTKRFDQDLGFRIEIPEKGGFFFLREDPDIKTSGTEVTLEFKSEALSPKAPWRKRINYFKASQLDNRVSVITKKKKGERWSAFSSGGGWRIPRIIASYAACLPFEIEIQDDNVRSVIKTKQMPSGSHQLVATCYPVSVTMKRSSANQAYGRYYSRGRYNSRYEKRLSVGGIYVKKMQELSLHGLGIPSWNGHSDSYSIDFSPDRIRMNLARSEILYAKIKPEDVLAMWKHLEPQFDDMLRGFQDLYDKKNYFDVTKELLELIDTLPPIALDYAQIASRKYVQYVTFKILDTGDLCVWRGNIDNMPSGFSRSAFIVDNSTNIHEMLRGAKSQPAYPAGIYFLGNFINQASRRCESIRLNTQSLPEHFWPESHDRSHEERIDKAFSEIQKTNQELLAVVSAFAAKNDNWSKLPHMLIRANLADIHRAEVAFQRENERKK